VTSIGTYGFINAKVRAMRSFLLDKSDYQEALTKAGNIDELFSILSRTHYRNVIEKLESREPALVEQTLFLGGIERLKLLEKSSRGDVRKIILSLFDHYEGERLKIILRCWHKKDEKIIQLYRDKIIYDFPVDAIISAGDISEVVGLLEETPFYNVLAKKISAYLEHKTLFPLELAIDRDYFTRFWKTTESLSRKDKLIVRRLVGLEVDIRNLNWMSRFKKYYDISSAEIIGMLLPYGYRIKSGEIQDVLAGGSIKNLLGKVMGKTSSLVQEEEQEETSSMELMERVLYQVLLSEANRAFGQFPFTIGAIMGYFVLIRIETKNIRTLIEAKIYGLSPDETEALLIV